MLSHFHLYGELRSPGVMERRNGPSGLRDDYDDEMHELQHHAELTLKMEHEQVVIDSVEGSSQVQG